eukprot:TRINITY_DN516_c1_g4_i4.p1 TRINITY_DN516_c1_g4~~TRINITY_DN516_c1_g4_i4.p1  ORF type:complete len:304 (+),score=64.38 TRINITY_DN516_c1_g4_i4:100-1011(+)
MENNNLNDIIRPGLPNFNERKWDFIVQKLEQYKTITSIDELIEMICSFNGGKVKKLPLLKSFYEDFLDEQKKEYFLKELYVFLRKEVLKTNELFGESSQQSENRIRILKFNNCDRIQLTKAQVVCILSNMFLCTTEKLEEMNDCSFLKIFSKDSVYLLTLLAKMKTFLNYFERMIDLKGKFEGFININRICICEFPIWKESESKLCRMEIREGLIEESTDCAQVDFANQFIGGGALEFGNVQEEMRFAKSPELLVTMLLCHPMHFNEAIIITGTQLYSSSIGYGGRWRFAGNFQDPTTKKRII